MLRWQKAEERASGCPRPAWKSATARHPSFPSTFTKPRRVASHRIGSSNVYRHQAGRRNAFPLKELGDMEAQCYSRPIPARSHTRVSRLRLCISVEGIDHLLTR